MGVEVSILNDEEPDECDEWEFTGRTKEISAILDKVNSKSVKTVLIHGPRKIGKSRLMHQIVKHECLSHFDLKVCVNFEMYYRASLVELIKFLKEFCAILHLAIELEEEVVPCKTCHYCTKDKSSSCVIRKITPLLTGRLKNSAILLCFDNADTILRSNNDQREDLLYFLNTVTLKCKTVKTLVTSSIRYHMTSKGSAMFLLNRMETFDLKNLLIEVKNYGRFEDDDSSADKQDPLLNVIAQLCDGIPACAVTLGKSVYILYEYASVSCSLLI